MSKCPCCQDMQHPVKAGFNRSGSQSHSARLGEGQMAIQTVRTLDDITIAELDDFLSKAQPLHEESFRCID